MDKAKILTLNKTINISVAITGYINRLSLNILNLCLNTKF